MTPARTFSDTEEITRLRDRVSELEKQVAERNRVHASLEESRTLFDAFLSRTPALAWMKDTEGRYAFANRSFHEAIEPTGLMCLGKTDYDLWPRGVADRFRASDRKAVESAGLGESLEVFSIVGGGSKMYRVRRFRFRTRSGKVYVGGVAIEATGPPAAPHMAGSELVGVMECSGETISNANETLLRWLGYTPESAEGRGMNWRDITPEIWRERDDAALAEIRGRGCCSPYEKEFLDVLGQAVPVLVSASAIDNAADTFSCVVLNLSDRRQAETRLLHSQKLESLGLIAGGVAHDINNLLATIMGNASLSLDALPVDHPAARALNEVVIASRRASGLTQQVLAYSGRAVIRIQPVDLSNIVREIGNLLETTISKKITLKCELAEDLPQVDADEGQLQQVIMNLVINASDAIGEKRGEILVSTRAVDEGRCVAFEVRDTGPGMTEATKARIFDPFFTTKAHGRGLGLAAVLGIVRSHRGSLLVESEPGAGTTFRVVFPASSAATVQEVPPGTALELRGDETVLVVDDDESIRRMTQTALQRLGYRVLLASNGEEGVRVFEREGTQINVVLLDWAMPVMNGEEALSRILAMNPSATVLMSSGYAETETMQKVGKPRIAGFVQKPYTTALLAGHIRKAIAQK